ncbi:hypothetical protein A3D11_01015 [Candidatus Peribacteria bacterium RIFCSPHIGHO2_02_FULL_49_16]|nr:MAG: hypothetical protein A2880_00070 [Candidatus Peribacteria bacterium RIFCSPHIGHO2_01_FULL_49_38]OGJ59734.1 MAG: hypothetical protein A3D11_01015 [Candidatus Peribacteria bacterium RIFCSPHIGHO2_02_FULL_49_16]
MSEKEPSWQEDAIHMIHRSIPRLDISLPVINRAMETACKRFVRPFAVQVCKDGMHDKMCTSSLAMEALKLDATFSVLYGEMPASVANDHLLSGKISSIVFGTAFALYDALGEEGREVSAALLSHAVGDAGICSMADVFSAEEVLRIFLPEKANALLKKHGDANLVIQRLVTIMEKRRGFRSRVLRAVEFFIMHSERLLAGAGARQGFSHLLKAQKVQEGEYWHRMKKAAEEGKFPGQREDDEERLSPKLREKILLHANKELLAIGENEIPQTLMEAIDCEGYRKRLQKVYSEQSPIRSAALQKEIVQRVFFEVQRYEHQLYEGEESGHPRNAYPCFIVTHKYGTCFGGLWLNAALLLRCGIAADDLVYGDIHQHHDGLIGGHAHLLLQTENKELVVIDHGYRLAGHSYSIKGFHKDCRKDVIALLEKRRIGPVLVKPESEKIGDLFKMPKSMTIMPLFDGFSGGHLFHVGVEFFHEGKLHEAERAFLLASQYCPLDPDVLYYRGMTAERMGKRAEAKLFLHEAVAIFPCHLQSRFSLGEIDLAEKDFVSAVQHFLFVDTLVADVWGDQTFRIKARKLAARLTPFIGYTHPLDTVS